MPSDMCSPTWETHIICDMSFPTVAFQLPSLTLLLLKIFLTTLLVDTDLSLNGLILELVYYASKCW